MGSETSLGDSHRFQESWVFKAPSPKIRGWKSWICGIHALLEMLSSHKHLQGCEELEQAAVTSWPTVMRAACMVLGMRGWLCSCCSGHGIWLHADPWVCVSACRYGTVFFQVWQQIPGPATCKLQWCLSAVDDGAQSITAPGVGPRTPSRPPPNWEKGFQGMARVAELSQLCQAICVGSCWGRGQESAKR